MISLAVLTVITAIISYEHAYEVFRAAHNTGLLAILGPLVPDLVIAVCSMALLAAAGQGDERPGVAIVALTGFIGVTVALNVAAGLRYGRGSALLAVLAPVGYLTGLHILAGMLRRRQDGASPGDAPADCGHQVAMNLDEAIKAASPFLSENELAANFTVSLSAGSKAIVSNLPDYLTVKAYISKDDLPPELQSVARAHPGATW